MSDLSLIPLQDGFETQLSQDWDGNTGTVYVLATPSYTPTTTNTYIVVNPGKTNMQIAEITDYDSTAKTLTVSSISFEKGLGISSTAQAHSTGSKVIISDNYQFWEDIQTAINTKLDDTGGTMTGLLQFTGTTHAGVKVNSLTTTQRDALTPANGNIIYNSTAGEFQVYQGGAWSTLASGSTQPNASATVAGKVEIATTAESIAGTDTGGTGALLSVLPSDIAKNTQSGTFLYGEDSGGDDTYVVTLIPALTAYTTGQRLRMKVTTSNTGACTADFGPGAKSIKLPDGTDPLNGDVSGIVDLVYDGTNLVLDKRPNRASDAAVQAGTNTTDFITPYQFATYLPTPLTQQELPLMASTAGSVINIVKVACETDGSAIYLAFQASTGSTMQVRRFAKNSTTGQFILTHTTTRASSGGSNWTDFSITTLSTYLYLVGRSNVGATTEAHRFDKADLTNPTSITVSGTTWTNGTAATTNGTDLLIYDSGSDLRRYTVSGTTITNQGTITFTSMSPTSLFYDGTSIYSTSSFGPIYKYSTSGGSSTSSTSTYQNAVNSVYPNQGSARLLLMKTGVMGYILPYSVETNAAMIGGVCKLSPLGPTSF